MACMPGVPREMKPMLVEQVVPFLRDRFGAHETIVTRVIHTIGLGESEIDYRIGDLFRSCENPKIAVLAHEFRADVKIMAKAPDAAQAEAMIAPLQNELVRRLEDGVFGYDADTPASAALALLGVAASAAGARRIVHGRPHRGRAYQRAGLIENVRGRRRRLR